MLESDGLAEEDDSSVHIMPGFVRATDTFPTFQLAGQQVPHNLGTRRCPESDRRATSESRIVVGPVPRHREHRVVEGVDDDESDAGA